MQPPDFEQQLIEKIADEIAEVATDRFREALSGGGKVFELPNGARVELVGVDHFDVGGLLITVDADDGTHYIVRFEIRSGHYAVEAVPLAE
jgi:hypothetical protein